MGITLNVSNALSPMSLQLASDLKAITGDPFRAQWVITQTEGMNSWLKTALAKELGIASNIRFCKPNDIVSRVHQWCTYPARPALDSETTRWYLYTLLGSQAFREAHPDIQAYFGSNDIKRIALADQLADLFDQYQVYRYEHIKTWNKVGAEIPAGDWQAWLWQQMKAKVAAAAGDRVEMADEIIKGLENPEVQDLLRRKIGQLHFFGIAVITPYYLRIFHALSACIDIHFYLINPSPEQYWLDDRSEKQITRLLQKRNRQRSYDEHFLQGNDLLLIGETSSGKHLAYCSTRMNSSTFTTPDSPIRTPPPKPCCTKSSTISTTMPLATNDSPCKKKTFMTVLSSSTDAIPPCGKWKCCTTTSLAWWMPAQNPFLHGISW